MTAHLHQSRPAGERASEDGWELSCYEMPMRWAAVASLIVATAFACGGRSEFFDDRGFVEGGGEAGEGNGSGGRGGSGKGGRGGSSSGRGGSSGGDDGGTTAVGGFGGTFAGFGGIGATGGFGASGGTIIAGTGGTTGGVGATAGVGVGGSVAGIGGMGGVGALGGKGGNAGFAGFGGNLPSECIECLTSPGCPQAQECFNDPECVPGILCGIALCTGDLTCWIECFDGNIDLAVLALQAGICLAQQCSVACTLPPG